MESEAPGKNEKVQGLIKFNTCWKDEESRRERAGLEVTQLKIEPTLDPVFSLKRWQYVYAAFSEAALQKKGRM